MAVAEERYRQSAGDTKSLRVGYTVTGATSEDDALLATYKAAPPAMPMQSGSYWNSANRNQWRWRWDIGVEEVRLPNASRNVANATYFTFVTYQQRAVCPILTYDFSTQDVEIYEGISRREFPRTGNGTYDDYIGINQDAPQGGQLSVRGTNKRAGVGRINIIWQPLEGTQPDGTAVPWVPFLIDPEYQRRCLDMLVKVNSTTFLSAWNPGEVLMIGFTARPINQWLGTWEFNYSFEIRQNALSRTIDGITVTDIKGWEYVWGLRDKTVKHQTGGTENKKTLVDQYSHIFVEQIYEEADFNHLFYNGAGANMVKSCPNFGALLDQLPIDSSGFAFPPVPPEWPSTP